MFARHCNQARLSLQRSLSAVASSSTEQGSFFATRGATLATEQGSFFTTGGTTLAEALGVDSVSKPTHLANPLGVDSCEICGLDVKHACAICRQGIDVVVECVEPELQFLGFELDPIKADQQRA